MKMSRVDVRAKEQAVVTYKTVTIMQTGLYLCSRVSHTHLKLPLRFPAWHTKAKDG